MYSQYSANCHSNGGYTIALDKRESWTDSGTLTTSLQSLFSDNYPACSVNSCQVPLATSSSCEIDNNDCVCTDNTLVSSIATCLGKQCPGDVSQDYSTYSSICLESGYTMALSQSQWDEESNVQSAETTAQTSQPTSTNTIQNSNLSHTVLTSSDPSSAISTSSSTSNQPPSAQSTGEGGSGNGDSDGNGGGGKNGNGNGNIINGSGNTITVNGAAWARSEMMTCGNGLMRSMTTFAMFAVVWPIYS